jgi:indolepyruvate ferredoxin oxidoreductase beta subunit
VLTASQIEVAQPVLRQGGTLIAPDQIDEAKLANRKSLNVALLGVLASHLDFPESLWHQAITRCLPEKLHASNFEAFAMGKKR